MRRRDFIKATVGVVTAGPVAVRAEQSAMPVIGYLGGSSPAYRGHLLTAFWRGLRAPALLMRAHALATVGEWKKRLEHQAHSRSKSRGGCGLPVATGAVS